MFALGIEGLERFVQREPLRRVHESFSAFSPWKASLSIRGCKAIVGRANNDYC
jgi:hypothetical protein